MDGRIARWMDSSGFIDSVVRSFVRSLVQFFVSVGQSLVYSSRYSLTNASFRFEDVMNSSACDLLTFAGLYRRLVQAMSYDTSW